MPLSPSQTKELLSKLGHQPNKKLGQNFLIDGNIVRKSVELAGLQKGDAVVEVGPGLGTLSQAILASGSKLWAVERDPALSAYLRESLLPGSPQFHLTEGDCLDFPLAGLPSAQSDDFKIVANLPYAVSTPWMEAVLSGPLPECMVLMLQKEAADRYAAQHGSKNFGAISIFLQSAYTIRGKHPVSAACFCPAPKVDSALLWLERKPNAVRFSEAARQCVRRIFTQRRKQLGALCRKEAEPEAKFWFAQLLEQGVSDNVRPEEVPLEHWQALAKALS
ncbi:ribosomal RNA small subunit methyltransferase A [Coraliomargarita sinensis]|uniref:Ribosomal RNA small subunit methyltransferase A n=1 Tax=Coraliomargarita sinensis TaxID=2174842 RepID=A0A317ZDG9_9BACT|nr:16S rRNA (adenine(1518)-N(6)/adenine(1519)-N(6))-dimethyltransferase RsmA [Coraliomargarita sinensis]PXA03256.1 ribosomal RNA small subunit methyltransferase A [Coraliomargarita sinensis]